jgi:hypothetical protein
MRAKGASPMQELVLFSYSKEGIVVDKIQIFISREGIKLMVLRRFSVFWN